MAGIAGKRWIRMGHGALCVVVFGGGIVAAATHDGSGDSGPCGSSDPLDPAGILDCLADDVAHITTPVGAGSAVLLPDGRLLTNAHVVDPFAAVDIGFRDGTTVEDVPVIGVDLLRDLAVLGPIERESDVVLADEATIDELVQGDQLFLVGYPGDIEASALEPSISQGILSRERVADRFGGLTYLQTDASIGGGQSGGALVDGAGHVVGISGLSFAENFALALASPDVVDGVDGIDDDGGSDYQPTGIDTVESGTVPSGIDGPPLMLSWAPSTDEKDVRLELDGGDEAYLEVRTYDGELLWAPRDALEAEDYAEMLGIDESTRDRLLDQIGNADVAEFTIPADAMAVATLASFGFRDFEYRSSVPATEHTDEDDGDEIETGFRREGTIGAFEIFDTYAIDLEEDETIDIYVGSVAADMMYAVYPEGALFDEQFEFVDDSEEGFYGLDAHGTFTAPEADTYVIEVGAFDFYSLGYVIEVQKG